MEHTTPDNAVNDTLRELQEMVDIVKQDGEVSLSYMKGFERDTLMYEKGREEEKKNTERERRRADFAEKARMKAEEARRKEQERSRAEAAKASVKIAELEAKLKKYQG